MLKSEEIAGSSFQHCVGGGEVRQVVFASDVCSKTPKVQVCLENLVHDCRFKALQVAVAVISSQSSFRKLIEWARFTSNSV